MVILPSLLMADEEVSERELFKILTRKDNDSYKQIYEAMPDKKQGLVRHYVALGKKEGVAVKDFYPLATNLIAYYWNIEQLRQYVDLDGDVPGFTWSGGLEQNGLTIEKYLPSQAPKFSTMGRELDAKVKHLMDARAQEKKEETPLNSLLRMLILVPHLLGK